MKYSNEILRALSPHIFWNRDITKLDLNKNKKLIVERIIQYGLEKDEILLWKIYSYSLIKKIATNMDSLDYDRINYYSSILKVRKEKFKCYKNKSYLWNC